jgi:hypothetical protein
MKMAGDNRNRATTDSLRSPEIREGKTTLDELQYPTTNEGV